jgi:hypothetical protein
MEIRIRATGQVMYEGEFRALHPDTSFPQQLTVELLNDFGADPVLEGPQAQPTRYQTAYRDGVEQIDGQWFTKYSVADMDQAGKDAVDAQLKQANRDRAKQELVDTDWCENASVRDTNNTPHLLNGADFDTYRLALRVIVLNPPVDVQAWPTQPQGVWST